MARLDRVCFQGGGLDRAGHLRARTQSLSQDEAARVLPIWRGKPLAHGGADHAESLAWLDLQHPALMGISGPLIFLGLAEGAPRFACDVSAWEPPGLDATTLGSFTDPSEQAHPGMPKGTYFIELRRAMTRLSELDAELVAVARALTQWHQSHGFCSRCGHASDMSLGGWQRDCPACGTSHYPRTDPVVIMLITHGNRVLLGRNVGWPDRMYSLLAGFVEPGETPEDAVRREVMEETKVPVGRVRYLASQPWPFPTQLMSAWIGEALDDQIEIDPSELVDARWVSREELAEIFRGGHPEIAAARAGAVARAVLAHWLADRLDALADSESNT